MWRHGTSAWLAWAAERPVRDLIAVGGQYLPLVEREPWRLATSVLLHVDVLHLGFNLVALALMGRLLEPWVGGARFAAAFCAGGVAGSVASHLAGLAQSDGASGGIFALLGAAAVLGRRHRASLSDEDRRLYGRSLWVAIGLNLLLSLPLPFLDMTAHLGGLAVGLTLGTSWRTERPGRPWWTVSFAFVAACAWGWTR